MSTQRDLVRPSAPAGTGREARGAFSALALLALLLAGCSSDQAKNSKFSSAGTLTGPSLRSPAAGSTMQASDGGAPPAELVTVQDGGVSLQFWPYTGAAFDGVPSDPVNLVFRGNADPRTIRAALMALDGDRTAFGFPPAPPFNQRWGDAIGDVQTNWAAGEGWTGSVLQLALGDYGPVRVHLRLFRTTGAGGQAWTLGAAHFEVLIPGTSEHQVLSWMLARQTVVADLARSGLLVAPPGETGVISATPSFREIPPEIYNGLPVELRAAIGGPLGDQQGPVPLASDGKAAILTLGGEPNHGIGHTQSFTLQFGQAIPKPLCADGPYDWVYVEGPIHLERSSTVDETGLYSYTERGSGRLTVTPVDITTNPPTPIGTPYSANISEFQQGSTGNDGDAVFARSARIAPQNGGAELINRDLKVSWEGPKSLRTLEQCLQPTP